MRRSLLASGLFWSVALSGAALAQTPAAPPPPPAPAAPTAPPAMTAPTPPPAAAAPTPPPAPPPPPPAEAAPAPAPAPDASGTPSPAPKKPAAHTMTSGGASNLTAADTHSEIAPKLPTPAVSGDAGPRDYLVAAQKALKAHRTGEAQNALEMAETRSLDRSVPVDQAGTPNSDPMVATIRAALDSLGNKDEKGAQMSIDKALSGAKPDMPADKPMGKPMHHHPMMKKTAPPPAQ